MFHSVFPSNLFFFYIKMLCISGYFFKERQNTKKIKIQKEREREKKKYMYCTVHVFLV